MLNVSRVESKLKFRVRKKHVCDANTDGRHGNVLNRLLCLVVVASLAFDKLGGQTTIEFDGLNVIRFLLPSARLSLANRAIAIHPLGVVEERIVVPIGLFTWFECLFKLIWNPLP